MHNHDMTATPCNDTQQHAQECICTADATDMHVSLQPNDKGRGGSSLAHSAVQQASDCIATDKATQPANEMLTQQTELRADMTWSQTCIHHVHAACIADQWCHP